VKSGYLSEYFEAVAAKRLSAVEANPGRSNQHEYNGVEDLKALFGKATERHKFPAHFIYLNDFDYEAISADAFVTWYDARLRHPTRSEHRLYYPSTPVSQCANEGDLLIIGRLSNSHVLIVIAESGSTIEKQLLWLFGFDEITHPGFSVRGELESEQDRIGFAARTVLEAIGIEPEDRDETYLDVMIQRFGRQFPTSRIFSEFARSTLPDISPLDNPDAVLLAWLEREEILFRTLERELVAERLDQGFSGDVDGFLSFSLSVQNRRKSRAGASFENHLEVLFSSRDIRYDRGKTTENKSKPDFLFPGVSEYNNPEFPETALTMLAAKSTCKDRWRQALTEADRIRQKHLATLEPAISEAQTDEMRARDLQLVVPESIHETYSQTQRQWLVNLDNFISQVRAQQGS